MPRVELGATTSIGLGHDGARTWEAGLVFSEVASDLLPGGPSLGVVRSICAGGLDHPVHEPFAGRGWTADQALRPAREGAAQRLPAMSKLKARRQRPVKLRATATPALLNPALISRRMARS
jgi:hypothetical protein